MAENNSFDTMPDLSFAINKLLEDPSIISAVASALGNSAPKNDSSISPSGEEDPTPETLPVLSAIGDTSKLSALTSMFSSPLNNDRTCLLNALKPYMSPRRRDAIDKIIKFSGVSEILKKL